MRPISNERPEFLVLEKCNESAIACYSDGEMRLLKKWLRQKFSQMAPHVLKIYKLIFFHVFAYKSLYNAKKILLIKSELFMIQIYDFD